MALNRRGFGLPDEQPNVEGPDRPKYSGNEEQLKDSEVEELAEGVTTDRLMELLRAADKQAGNTEWSKKKADMARSWRAYNNQFVQGSKYLHANFSNRSKVYVPKTRTSVDRKKVAAAMALFSTDNVVSVKPADDSNPRQLASSELNKHLLDYRLDRTNHKAGVPWFTVCMGAVMDCSISGFCVSKQFWEYEEMQDDVQEEDDETETGAPMMGEPRILRDRPMIEPIPPENVILDLAAPWYDVVQGGSYFICKWPMQVANIRTMMKPGRQHMGGGAWKEIPDKVLGQAVQDYSGSTVRSARGGSDRQAKHNQPKVQDYDIVWVYENFIRCEGRDWHFWSLGTRELLSEPREVMDSYPAFHGERPYVLGFDSIDVHNPTPMSMVEAMRPLQDEINDLRNLTLDTLKQGIAPIAVVKRGAQIDLRQVNRRGPDATIMANDIESDIRFEPPHSPDASAFTQMDRLNVEIDEQVGAFSSSAVQSNRNLNETVGGMGMINQAANAVQEFYLRVFVETYVERVLRHLVWLEQYYETDETLLAIAAQKAELYERFGVDQGLDQLLEEQVTVMVNVGIGATDPMQRLQKFGMAVQLLGGMAQTGIWQGQIMGKAEPTFDEVLGLVGYKEANRFFDFVDAQTAQQNQPPDPEQEKLKIEQQKLQVDVAKAQAELQMKQLEGQIAEQEAHNQLALNDQEFQLKQQEFQLKNQEFGLKVQGQQMQQEMDQRNFQMQEFGQLADLAMRQREFGAGREDANRDFGMRGMEFKAGRDDAANKTALDAATFGAGRQDADRDFGMRGQEFAAGRQDATHAQGMDQARFGLEEQGAGLEQQRFGHEVGSQRQDLMLRMNEQNKAITEEKALEGEGAPPPALPATAAPQPQSAFEQIIGALTQVASSIGESTAAMAQAVTQMAQTQEMAIQSAAAQTDAITMLAQTLAAPKQVVRDGAGQIVGVEPVMDQSPVPNSGSFSGSNGGSGSPEGTTLSPVGTEPGVSQAHQGLAAPEALPPEDIAPGLPPEEGL
jgi:hypothetical protein